MSDGNNTLNELSKHRWIKLWKSLLVFGPRLMNSRLFWYVWMWQAPRFCYTSNNGRIIQNLEVKQFLKMVYFTLSKTWTCDPAQLLPGDAKQIWKTDWCWVTVTAVKTWFWEPEPSRFWLCGLLCARRVGTEFPFSNMHEYPTFCSHSRVPNYGRQPFCLSR